jgi:hypothetical protein
MRQQQKVRAECRACRRANSYGSADSYKPEEGFLKAFSDSGFSEVEVLNRGEDPWPALCFDGASPWRDRPKTNFMIKIANQKSC